MEKKNDNMRFYEALRKVPKEAIKKIEAGNLKGMSNINPMWRIKALTEQFGPCGVGWYVEEVERWHEDYTVPVRSNNQIAEQLQVAVYIKVNLFVKIEGEWSNPIVGIGGSKEVGKGVGEGISDECYKMAYTDALSVACKALGVGADVYYESDLTKYGATQQQEELANLERKCQEDKKELADKINAAQNRLELDSAWNLVRKRFAVGTEYYNDLFEIAGARGRQLFSTSKRQAAPAPTPAPAPAPGQDNSGLENLNIDKLF